MFCKTLSGMLKAMYLRIPKMVCEALSQLPEFQALDEQEQHILFAAAILHDVENAVRPSVK